MTDRATTPSYLNQHFHLNATGKTIEVEVQPYRYYKGTLKTVTPRIIETKMRIPGKGNAFVKYEVFDCVVSVTEGHETGGFVCGVPISKPRDIAGTEQFVTLDWQKLYDAAFDGKCAVIISCG